MLQHVGVKSHHALFFAREQDEAQRATRLQMRLLDCARGCNDQGRVAAVVQGACSELPGVEMRGQDDEFITTLAAANFSNQWSPAAKKAANVAIPVATEHL